MQLRTIASKIAGLSLALVMATGVLLINAPKVSADNTVDDFVTRCYKVALGREPDEGGFNFWKKEITEGRLVGSSVVHQFIFSAEYESQNTSDKQFVNDLYTMFMGREADQSGYDFWCNELNTGHTREDVFAGFANSEEFYNVCSDCGITAGYYTNEYSFDQVNKVNLFVERLYKICLGRIGDKGGQEYWVKGLLKHELEGISCAANFINSREYIDKKLYIQDYVKNLYLAMMGREYDKGGLKYWVDLLGKNYSRDYVFAGFANSPEFRGICENYGILPGSYTPSKVYIDGYGIKHEYNDDNKLIKLTASDNPDYGIEAYVETFEYDSNGRLVKCTTTSDNKDSCCVTTYSNFDSNGDALHEESVYGNGIKIATDWSYPSESECTAKFTYYDKNGKVTGSSENTTKPFSYKEIQKDANGKPTFLFEITFADEDNDISKSSHHIDYASGTETNTTYDDKGIISKSETVYTDGRKEVGNYSSETDWEGLFYNKNGILTYQTKLVNSLVIESKSYNETTGELEVISKYSYNSNGQEIRRDDYDKNNTFMGYAITTYSDNEKTKTITSYDAAGNVTDSVIYEEKDNPKMTVTTYKLADGSLDFYTEDYQDEDGSLIKTVTHYADGTEKTTYPS